MIYRDFKGLKLSALGMGMMRLPTLGGDNGAIDEEKTAEILDLAFQSGVNYFDTAWGYHNGNSELMAGKLLTRYPRERYYLASKFPGYDATTFARKEEIFEKQLEKCGVDYFDFYLCHNVNEGNIDNFTDPNYGVPEYLLKQKELGRIKHLGFSCHGALPTLKRFLEAYGKDMEFCQLQLNYLDWHYQHCDEKVALCRSCGIPVWVMEPLRGGKLADPSQELKDAMREMRPQETVPGWAFRFLQALPEVGMILSGMSTLDQLKENLKTFETDQPLNENEMARLIELADGEMARAGVPCTACRYCTEYCPQGIDIPELLRLYNEYRFSGGRSMMVEMAVKRIPEGKKPADCLACGACAAVCPQQIDIPGTLAAFHDMLPK